MIDFHSVLATSFQKLAEMSHSRVQAVAATMSCILMLIVVNVVPRPAFSQADDRDIFIKSIKNPDAKLEYRIKACKELGRRRCSSSHDALINVLADPDVGFWAADTLWNCRAAAKERLENFARQISTSKILDPVSRCRARLMADIVLANREPFVSLAYTMCSNDQLSSAVALRTMKQILLADQDYRGRAKSKLEIAITRSRYVSTKIHAAEILALHFKLADRFAAKVENVFLNKDELPWQRAHALHVLGLANWGHSRVIFAVSETALGRDPILALASIKYLGTCGNRESHLTVLQKAQHIAEQRKDAIMVGETITAINAVARRINWKKHQRQRRRQLEIEQKRRHKSLAELKQYIHRTKQEQIQRVFSNPFMPDTSEELRICADSYESTAKSWNNSASFYARIGDTDWALQCITYASQNQEWADSYRRDAETLDGNPPDKF